MYLTHPPFIYYQCSVIFRSQEPNITRVNVCTEAENESTECMRSLRGLRAGRTYEAWVKAATSVGEGPPSVAIASQTTSLGI